jgi:hypothetical protein
MFFKEKIKLIRISVVFVYKRAKSGTITFFLLLFSLTFSPITFILDFSSLLLLFFSPDFTQISEEKSKREKPKRGKSNSARNRRRNRIWICFLYRFVIHNKRKFWVNVFNSRVLMCTQHSVYRVRQKLYCHFLHFCIFYWSEFIQNITITNLTTNFIYLFSKWPPFASMHFCNRFGKSSIAFLIVSIGISFHAHMCLPLGQNVKPCYFCGFFAWKHRI